MQIPLLLLALLVLVVPLQGQRTQDAPVGLDALTQLERLPLLRTNTWFGSVSSQDVTGGNDDGFSGSFSYLYQQDGRYVLLEMPGPGCVYVFRSILFDGSLQIEAQSGEAVTTDLVSFDELYSGERAPFLGPLVRSEAQAHGSAWSFVPLCAQDGLRLSSNKPGKFLNIFYHRFGNGTRVEPYSRDMDVSSAVERWKRVGEPLDRGKGKRISRTVTVPAGSRVPVINVSEAGTISELRIRIPKLTHAALRHVRLRAYWDGADRHAVDSPLGPFFGTGYWPIPDPDQQEPRYGHNSKKFGPVRLGRVETQALPVGTSSDGFYCFFPMPFRESALLELVNESDVPLQGAEVTVHVVPGQPPANSGSFHAVWHEERPTREHRDYTVLETRGHGHYVGAVLVMSSVNYDPDKRDQVQRLYLEGDARFYIDGNRTPVNAGTGTEEYFNWGWYDLADKDSVFSYQVSGYPVHDIDVQDHSVMYRFHLSEVVPYYRSFRFALEHGGEGDVPSHHSSTAFFYQRTEPALEMTDALAIGDSQSESLHGYLPGETVWEGSRVLPFEGERQIVFSKLLAEDQQHGTSNHLSEGLYAQGRRSKGTVRFSVKVFPGNEGVKLRRLLDYSPPGLAGQNLQKRPAPLIVPAERARVWVDDNEVREWSVPPHHARLAWLEDDFEIPARLTAGKNRLRIRLEIEDDSAWSEFGYRVYCYRVAQ